MLSVQAAILKLLRDHWGYSEFRPKQEAVISAIMDGSDVAVVMPTGGGKSLCYQLPAAALGKTALVVSPLLALMHDQVAQLTAAVQSGSYQVDPQAVSRAIVDHAIRG